jgi:hypothetical protein
MRLPCGHGQHGVSGRPDGGKQVGHQGRKASVDGEPHPNAGQRYRQLESRPEQPEDHEEEALHYSDEMSGQAKTRYREGGYGEPYEKRQEKHGHADLQKPMPLLSGSV